MPGKLQILQRFTVAGFEEGKQIRSCKDQAIYVGMANPTNRLANDGKGEATEEEKEDKNIHKEESTAEGSQQNKK